jgi:hypothetical protein
MPGSVPTIDWLFEFDFRLTERPNDSPLLNLFIPGKKMAFEYSELDAAAAGQLLSRACGPVLAVPHACAIDRETGAIFVDLGGKPDLEPDRGEPPGHFNLIWGTDVFAGAGYYEYEKQGSVWLTRVDMRMSVPKAAAGRLEDVKRLMQEGMDALWSCMARRPKNVVISFSEIIYF